MADLQKATNLDMTFHGLIGELVLAYQELEAARDAFVASVQSETTLPAWTPGEDTGAGARAAVIEEWGRFFRLPDGVAPTPAGVVCASATSVARSEEFNVKKAVFSQTVQAIKAGLNAHKRSFDQVLKTAVNKTGSRSEEWSTILFRSGLAQLDLRHVYAPVCRQPASLESLSYTWSSRHRLVYRVSAEEACAEARKLPDDVRERVERILARYHHQDFARLAKERAAMRVNALYRENGQRVRTTLAPTLFLLEGKQLPQILWRETPTNLPRLTRHDRAVSTEPVIPELGLHAYR